MPIDPIELTARLLARWMPSAFSSVHSEAKEYNCSWPTAFGPEEQEKFRLVARALSSAGLLRDGPQKPEYGMQTAITTPDAELQPLRGSRLGSPTA